LSASPQPWLTSTPWLSMVQKFWFFLIFKEIYILSRNFKHKIYQPPKNLIIVLCTITDCRFETRNTDWLSIRQYFWFRTQKTSTRKPNEFKGVAAMWQTGVNLTYENNQLVYFFVLIIVSWTTINVYQLIIIIFYLFKERFEFKLLFYNS
jgi:hypothetical protein